jgi:ketosteroid isomerase-like protein
MNCKAVSIVIIVFILSGCQSNIPAVNLNTIKQEILNREKEFEALTAQVGIEKAFYEFAADSAVILRGNQIIKGRTEIRNYLSKSSLKNVQLLWDAEFVDVSASGDMAYTFGKYKFNAIDSLDKTIESTGYFHTVWKKQADGTWKFVWD